MLALRQALHRVHVWDDPARRKVQGSGVHGTIAKSQGEGTDSDGGHSWRVHEGLKSLTFGARNFSANAAQEDSHIIMPRIMPPVKYPRVLWIAWTVLVQLWATVQADIILARRQTHASSPVRVESRENDEDDDDDDRDVRTIFDLIELCLIAVPLALIGWTVIWLSLQRCMVRLGIDPN